MDPKAIGGKLLNGRAGAPLIDLGSRILYRDRPREQLTRAIDWWISSRMHAHGARPASPGRSERELYLTALAILHTMDRLLEQRYLDPHLLSVIMGLWGRALFVPPEQRPAVQRFKAERGCEPPWFIVVSPGHACNLRCRGCYSSSDASAAKLPWSVLDRIISQARELWDIRLVVFSGGEPLAYRSEGKDLLDAVEKHSDCLFLMFTNGTLIDLDTASRLARLGNLTPALSVEGMRESTDASRGEGVFDQVLAAMALLREAGVPVGVSGTITRSNCEELLSDRFIDFFFREQGAFYGFFFHYMPMGRDFSLDRVPTPEQRLEFWRRSWELIAEKRTFLFDFWNYAPLVRGCVSAGREKGYIYIDWNGKVMPCVFAPHSVGNVLDVFAAGGTLNDLWEAPFFQAIRQWQRDYGYGRKGPVKEGNWLRPCPARDHYGMYRELVELYRPEPEDEAAREALADEGYARGMVAYGEELGRLSQAIWESEYC